MAKVTSRSTHVFIATAAVLWLAAAGYGQDEVSSPCSNNNGGCQHMCNESISGSDGLLAYSCSCNIGYHLAEDMHNCVLVEEFLLYSDDKFIKGKVLSNVSQGYTAAILPVTTSNAGSAGLDFDARDNYIYYSDVSQNIIYRIHRNGTGKEIVSTSPNGCVEGLVVDWVAKNLYYIDSRKGTLNVVSTRNVTNQRVLLKITKKPSVQRGIVVHPNKGYIFFSEMGISRAYTDGSNLIKLGSHNQRWPRGLALDFATDRLYWCDVLSEKVQHSNLDGTDVRDIISTSIRSPWLITIHKDWMYIIDWDRDAIMKLHKLTGVLDNIEVRQPRNWLMGVKVYSEHEQLIINNHPCSIAADYGGCQKLCFAVPFKKWKISLLKARCDCPFGEMVDSDGKTCVTDPNAESMVCPNAQDFACNNMRCIPKAYVCDGYDDCHDNSDEALNCTRAEYTEQPSPVPTVVTVSGGASKCIQYRLVTTLSIVIAYLFII
ncbi:PREDICTED: low-density lipoprotein receptor-related protein 2-like [Diuraphis noxia]|uniref:low-density lipoprotein receptor-related protein 2-like n=1 Tax=Diuraphis noxia TaxID=143948 RepID=UPI000763AAB9|nr:PREDICTED: low-density lipoprotein receptor-related protein 2-like [Diuraphis noxia]